MPTPKPSNIILRNDQRWCELCADMVSFRRFDRHTKSCQERCAPEVILQGVSKRNRVEQELSGI